MLRLTSAGVEGVGGGSGQLAATSAAVSRSKRAAKVKEDQKRAKAAAAVLRCTVAREQLAFTHCARLARAGVAA